MLEHVDPDVAAVGGLTLGADPLVVGLSQVHSWMEGRELDSLL